MSIKLQKNGTYLVRLQISTGKRGKNGKLKRRNTTKTCKTKSEAEQWEKKQLLQVSQHGKSNILNHSQLAEYTEAKKMARNEDLREVVRFWLKLHPEGEILTVQETWERYESSREFNDYKPRTKENKKCGIVKFIAAFGDTPITEVSVEDVSKYLDQFDDALTRNTNLSTIRTMFDWATDPERGYLQVNQLKLIKRAKVGYREVEINEVEDVKKLLEHTAKYDPTLIPFLALQYFAGIRTSELEGDSEVEHSRIEARDFDFKNKTILIRPEVAKTRGKGTEIASKRLIENLPDTLWMWLKAVKFDGNLDITNKQKRVSKLYHDSEVPFPKNVGRHSFASYAYGHYKEAGKVCKITGHSETVFKRHYHTPVSGVESKKYFSINPPSKIDTAQKRKYTKPNKDLTDEKLLQLSESLSTQQIADAYKLTYNAIKKRLDKLK